MLIGVLLCVVPVRTNFLCFNFLTCLCKTDTGFDFLSNDLSHQKDNANKYYYTGDISAHTIKTNQDCVRNNSFLSFYSVQCRIKTKITGNRKQRKDSNQQSNYQFSLYAINFSRENQLYKTTVILIGLE